MSSVRSLSLAPPRCYSPTVRVSLKEKNHTTSTSVCMPRKQGKVFDRLHPEHGGSQDRAALRASPARPDLRGHSLGPIEMSTAALPKGHRDTRLLPANAESSPLWRFAQGCRSTLGVSSAGRFSLSLHDESSFLTMHRWRVIVSGLDAYLR